MSKSDKKETTFFKEAFGFVEGLEVEVYLVDPSNNKAEFIGVLRPDYAHGSDYAHDLPRLYERFDLQISAPGVRHLYFGQKDKPPFIIPLNPDSENEGDFRGSIDLEKFRAKAELTLYSPYVDERYILTVEVLQKDFADHQSDSVLPEAWRRPATTNDSPEDSLPTV